MKTGYANLHKELKRLPLLMNEGHSDLQETTSIVRALFSVYGEIKMNAHWPWISKLSLFY